MAGGSASELEHPNTGDFGGLIAARAAVGIRYAHLMVELGYNGFVLGGTINSKKLADMRTLSREAPLPPPGDAVAAGEATRVFDVWGGITF